MGVDVMIVGARKSGTTSLLAYLGRHPGIRAPLREEMTWFSEPDVRSAPFPTALYFGQEREDGRLGLGKLAGLMYKESATARLREHNPSVQTVAILRDPVKRAYSSFWFSRQRGRETLTSFEQAIAGDLAGHGGEAGNGSSEYVEWGRYARYVERLQDTFGPDAVHVMIFEEFVEDPVKTVLPLLERLNLSPEHLPDQPASENRGGRARVQLLSDVRRKGGVARVAKRLLPIAARDALRRQYRRLNETAFRPPPLNPATERELRALFEEPNRQLEQLLGRRIEAWRRPLS